MDLPDLGCEIPVKAVTDLFGNAFGGIEIRISKYLMVKNKSILKYEQVEYGDEK